MNNLILRRSLIIHSWRYSPITLNMCLALECNYLPWISNWFSVFAKTTLLGPATSVRISHSRPEHSNTLHSDTPGNPESNKTTTQEQYLGHRTSTVSSHTGRVSTRHALRGGRAHTSTPLPRGPRNMCEYLPTNSRIRIQIRVTV